MHFAQRASNISTQTFSKYLNGTKLELTTSSVQGKHMQQSAYAQAQTERSYTLHVKVVQSCPASFTPENFQHPG